MPVNKQRHVNWSVKTGVDYEFARHLNAVPLIAAEFSGAAPEYAIVFSGTDEVVMPSVILGLTAGENLYVAEAGGWDGTYIPAFIRRYPFVFSSDDDGISFKLCIDERYSGWSQEGRGERLFDADGEQTQYLGNVLEFLKHYQVHFKRTQDFCARLVELKLLEPMRAQFTLPSGAQESLSGFMAVDWEKLKALSDEQLAGMARTDELELIYLHLQSIRNFSSMVARVADPVAGETAPDDGAQTPDAKSPAKSRAKAKTKKSGGKAS